MQTEHGKPGHLNTVTLDQDSPITGYGAHFRVIAFCPDAAGLYCRVDHKHGARMPTESEILKVARLQGARGRYRLQSVSAPWRSLDCDSTDYQFAAL